MSNREYGIDYTLPGIERGRERKNMQRVFSECRDTVKI